jgi:acylphosphatase
VAERISVRVRIEGRVQRVWFRGWTIEQARLRDLTGWVRNRSDGTVEALFSGRPAEVQAMLEMCRRGPPAARVAAVHSEPADPPGETDFGPRPTV